MGFVVNGHTSGVIRFLLTSALVLTISKPLVIRPFKRFPSYCSQRRGLLSLTASWSSVGSDQMTDMVIARLHPLGVIALLTPGLVSILLYKK